MATVSNLTGIIADAVMLGLTGPQLVNNSGVIEAKNNVGNAVVRLKFATGTDEADGVNFKQSQLQSSIVVVSAQANCTSVLPTNTVVRGLFTICTTAGSGAALGDYLYSDGSGTGSMQIVTPGTRQCTVPSVNLTGLTANCLYTYGGSGHIKVADPVALEQKFIFRADNVLSVHADLDIVYIPANITVTKVYFIRRVAGSSGTTTAVITKRTGGSNSTLTTASILQSDGDYKIVTNTLNTDIDAGDLLWLDVTAVEAGTAQDLVVELYYIPC